MSAETRSKFEFPIELYALAPTVCGLLLVELLRTSAFGLILKVPLAIVLVILAVVCTSSPAMLAVAGAVGLYQMGIPLLYAFVIPAAAIMLGSISAAGSTATKVSSVYGALLAIGAFQFAATTMGSTRIGLGLAAALVVIIVGLLFLQLVTVSAIAVSPLHYLHWPSALEWMTRGDDFGGLNGTRFTVHCVYFLLVGAPAWSSLLELTDFRTAAAAHVIASLLIPTFLMRAFQVPFEDLPAAVEIQTAIGVLATQREGVLQEMRALQDAARAEITEQKAKAAEEVALLEAKKTAATRDFHALNSKTNAAIAALDQKQIELNRRQEELQREIQVERDKAAKEIERQKALAETALEQQRQAQATAIAELSQEQEREIERREERAKKEIEATNASAQREAAALQMKLGTLDWQIADRTSTIEKLMESRAEKLAASAQQVLSSYFDRFFAMPWDLLLRSFSDLKTLAPPSRQGSYDLKDHFLIGRNPQSKEAPPLLLHEDVVREHIHILGGSGSHKTTLGIMPIVFQILRKEEKRPVVVVDLKGEPALFQSVRDAALRNDQEFVFFTIESGKPTYRFNPFIGLGRTNSSVNELAQPVLDALGLNHGEGYGRSYFTRDHRRILLEVLRDAQQRNKPIASLKELREAIKKRKRASDRQKDELISALEGLFEYPQLFTTAEEEAAQHESIIQFDRVLERNQVAYFWLPAPTQSISVREVGKLALYNLFFAAIRRRDANLPRRHVHLVIDEFQQVVGENLALFLSQARSYGISLLLANQNISQLNTNDCKLWPILNSNVRASLHFGSGDLDEVQMLSDASGETRDLLYGHSEAVGQGTASSRSEGSSHAISTGITHGTSRQESEGGSAGISSSLGVQASHASTRAVSGSVSMQTSDAKSFGISKTEGSSFGTSHGRQLGSTDQSARGSSQSTSFDPLMGIQHSSLSAGFTDGHSSSSGTSAESSRGSSYSVGHSEGTSSTRSTGISTSISEAESVSTGTSASESTSRERNWSQSEGTSFSLSETATAEKSFSTTQTQNENSTTTRSSTERVRPRLRSEDIQRVFNAKTGFILWVRRGAGMSDFGGQPIEGSGLFTMSLDQFNAFERRPWPTTPLGVVASPEQLKTKHVVPEKQLIQNLNDTLTMD